MARKPKPSGRRKRKGRSQSSLRRSPGHRRPRAHILIVCEGRETEPNYLNSFRRKLKLSSVEVEIEGKSHYSAPLNVVNFAIRRKTERIEDARRSDFLAEFDEVWCVIDVENPAHNTTFWDAIQKAKQEDLELAVSNPAFEFWYLLHYEETSRAFRDGQELKRYLKSHVPGYSENKNLFAELYLVTDLAIRRAKRIDDHHASEEPYPNPSTYVFRLVERLKKLATD